MRRPLAVIGKCILLGVILVAAILAGAVGGVSPAWAVASSPYFTALTASGATELGTARFDAMAAPLPDGQVLIAGGASASSLLGSAELFSPATDTFTTLPESGATELQTPREGAVTIALPDGQVLIAGGWHEGDLQSAELFDPPDDTFTALTAAGSSELQTARYGAVAATLPDGQVLIAGGYNESGGGFLQSAELFDPADDTFTALTAAGSSELQTAREFAVAAALPDGQVLIAGGQNNGGALHSAELFDPADNIFTALPAAGATELHSARLDAVAAPLPDGQVLITGGYSPSSPLLSAELFDPTSETFVELPETGETELPSSRVGAVAAALPDGQVLIAGGISGLNYLQSAELYYSAAQAAVAGGEFGDGTVGEPSPVAVLVVSNVGAQALSIATASLEGADSADFAIAADSCAGRRLAFEQSCTIAVRFTPTTTGEIKASVALSDNGLSSTPIALSGTGVAANSGPAGPSGPAGATGPSGPTGAAGPTGPTGATGQAGINGTNGADGTDGTNGLQGSPGQVELVTCQSVTTGKGKHRKTVQRCTTKLTSSPITFATTETRVVAALSREHIVYATGVAISTGKQTRLLLSPRQHIGKGSYTLTLTRRRKQQRETITIG